MSDRVDDVINNPAYDMLGGYHIFPPKDVDTNYHNSNCFIGMDNY